VVVGTDYKRWPSLARLEVGPIKKYAFSFLLGNCFYNTPMDKTEREVLDSCRVILDHLQERGVLFWKRMYLGARMQGGYKCKNPTAGMPDIFIFYQGQTGFVELKRPKGGRLDPKQIEFRDAAVKQNFLWALVTDDSGLLAFLTAMGIEWERYFPALKRS
jgi:hypothetical protein